MTVICYDSVSHCARVTSDLNVKDAENSVICDRHHLTNMIKIKSLENILLHFIKLCVIDF